MPGTDKESIIIRLYKKEDYKDILDISKHIWDGEDYLPEMINKYLTSPYCDPYVLLVNNKVATVANIDNYTPNSVWFEALRTHPDFRGQGYGTKLTEYLLDLVKAREVKEFWLSTSQQNKATTKMFIRLDFEEILLFNVWGFEDKSIDVIENELKENNGLVDGTLFKIEYLEKNVDKQIQKLSDSWKYVKELRELEKAIEKNTDQKGRLLFGEFITFPIHSYFVPEWVDKGFFYINQESGNIMSLKPTKETDRSYYIGINSLKEDVILSALLFGFHYVSKLKNKNEKIRIRIFYPNEIKIQLLDNKWIFRVMRKKLD